MRWRPIRRPPEKTPHTWRVRPAAHGPAGPGSTWRGADLAHEARSDARLCLTVVVAAAAGFVVLVVLPYAVSDFRPPAGTDVVWGLGGPLALVLAPVAAGLAGLTSAVSLWRHGDRGDTTRRLHLMALAGAAAFAVLLASEPGRAAVHWWRD